MQFSLWLARVLLLLLLTQGQMRQAWQARGHQLLLYERHFRGLGLQVWPASERAGSNVPTFPLFCKPPPLSFLQLTRTLRGAKFLENWSWFGAFEGIFQLGCERQKLDDLSLESMHPFWHRDFWQISDIMSFWDFHTHPRTRKRKCAWLPLWWWKYL